MLFLLFWIDVKTLAFMLLLYYCDMAPCRYAIKRPLKVGR